MTRNEMNMTQKKNKHDQKKETESKQQGKRVDIEAAIRVLGELISKEKNMLPEEIEKKLDMHKLDLHDFDLSETKLQRANFSNANLQKANFSKLTQRDVIYLSYPQSKPYHGANLEDACFREANLQETNFQNANLKKAEFWGAEAQEANFSHAKLQDARFGRAKLQEANFWEAKLQGANFSYAKLQRARFYDAELQGANFAGANLEMTDFTGANLENIKYLIPFEVEAQSWNKLQEQLNKAIYAEDSPPQNLPDGLKIPTDRAYEVISGEEGYLRRFVSGEWIDPPP